MKKKNALGMLAGAATLGGAYYGLCQYLYNNALLGHSRPAKNADTTDYGPLNELRAVGKAFAELNPPKIVEITSFDGLKLSAYEFNQISSKWVIIVHGYQGEATSMFHQAKEFYERGFNVLAVDCRGHGKSEGHYIGMGWHDRLDVKKWIEYILVKAPTAKIVLYGVSMGGATVMMTTGEDLPHNVVCAVEDCGYTSVYDIFASQIKKMYHIPPILILSGVNTLVRKEAGYDIVKASSINQLKKSQTPTLFIHGQEDDFVDFTMVFECYNACQATKELITASNVGHALAVTKPYYYLKVFEFIDRYI